jgi:hypothetical protein
MKHLKKFENQKTEQAVKPQNNQKCLLKKKKRFNSTSRNEGDTVN